MYLLARVIKSMGIKMVLSGEGADEVLAAIFIFTRLQMLKNFMMKQ
jgi:asparagine synthase (glutamine-hydrolysing)